VTACAKRVVQGDTVRQLQKRAKPRFFGLPIGKALGAADHGAECNDWDRDELVSACPLNTPVYQDAEVSVNT
jgi:hypothetical protein